jgi:pimeloyl-ACP methyl ester carboxylesterase
MTKRIAFLIALVFTATVSAQQPATAPARPATPPVMVGQKDGSFTTKDGVKIHYLTHGPSTSLGASDTASWVVLVHGYSDNAQRMWFNTGIAPEIAKHHRVVAIDNRNHGQSDKPTPGGSGRAEDVIELMDHLKIQRAHIHGYSMGGGIVGTLLGMIPERFITAGFGGSGMNETNAAYRAEAEAMDDALPKATGADAEGMDRFRSRVAAARPAGSAAAATAVAPPTRPSVDLTKLQIPILAVNGSFDNPYRKTHRLWREVQTFQNVILPGKTHLTAIAAGAAPSQQYIDAISKFIDAYDQK